MLKIIVEYAVIAARIVLGAWMIINGLNHWFDIFPQPMGNNPLWAAFMVSLIDTGLFGVVKVIEVIGGLMLIFNIFVPLALVMLLPMSAVIFWNGGILAKGAFTPFYMGSNCLYLNLFVMAAYFRHYIPMLAINAQPGSFRDLALLPAALRGMPQDSQPRETGTR